MALSSKIVSFIAALLLLLSVTPPASAFEVDGVPHNHKGYTLFVIHKVDVSKGWGIAPVARYYDRKVNGLRVEIRNCKLLSKKNVCVRVRDDRYGLTGAAGWYVGVGSPTDFAKIYLNKSYGKHWGVWCHELGHAFQIPHHKQEGCVGQGGRKYPSPIEIRKLRKAY